jgi:hypothetical protein
LTKSELAALPAIDDAANDKGECVTPVPADALAPPDAHPKLGKASARWTYLDAFGALLFEVWRFAPAGERKQFLPLSLWRDASGALRWLWKSVSAPRPLYGLDKLAANSDAPVVFCEGEKAADAAARIFPKSACMTSPGGCKAEEKANFELSRAANAIASTAQVPIAVAAQSVLAVTSLAASSHADVQLPFGQVRPLSLFFATVAASGDRKSTADNEALWPVAKQEKTLREVHADELKDWRTAQAAWSAEKHKIEGDRKSDFDDRKARLSLLGSEPEKPLSPFLVTGDFTIEGLTKNWSNAHAALGVFTAEGGMFTAGHGMNDDNRLKTAAMLSELWDGKPIKRVRALDGVTILPGRRLSLHVMVQPEAAAGFLCNDVLRDQGLLSRILVAAPASLAGSRVYREPCPQAAATIKAYGARLLSILEAKPALEPGTRNELAPRALPISASATGIWRQFYDHIEGQCGAGNGLEAIGDLAAKAAEHAARIAGVITIVEDLHAREIGLPAMQGAVTLADWYVGEAFRLKQAGRTDPKLLRAAKLLEWLQSQPDGKASFRGIIQFGPNAMRTKASIEEALAILAGHGWITEVSTRPRTIKAVTQ